MVSDALTEPARNGLAAADPCPSEDGRSPVASVFRWLVRGQRRRLIAGALVWSVFLGSQQFIPYVVSNLLQRGVVERDDRSVLVWTGALAALIALQAATGVFGYLLTQQCRVTAIFKTQRALVRHITRLGGGLARDAPGSEAVSVSSLDAGSFGLLLESLALTCGGTIAFAVGLVLLAAQAPILALVVGVGLPSMLLCLRPIFRLLERAKADQREKFGALVPLAGDIVTGLRVLRGVGGEGVFLSRYRAASEAVRDSGFAVARNLAIVDLSRVLLPGVLLLALLWTGVRLALTGGLTPGQFAALFGYIAFLTRPLQFTIAGIDTIAGARVSARRLYAFLSRKGDAPVHRGAPEPVPNDGDLHDPVTGITVGGNRLTGIVADGALRFATGGILDRLSGNPGPGPAATLKGVPLNRCERADVRRRIHALRHDAHLFSGSLREQLDVDGRRTDTEIVHALYAASALDIVGVDPARAEADTPPSAAECDLGIPVTERGRSLSGGQRQRLTLTRALLTEAPILLLDSPTSACDAHTEARIASRLAAYRAGRTTVVFTDSPTLLERCDEVIHLVADANGDVTVATAGTGSPKDPSAFDEGAYRSAVSR